MYKLLSLIIGVIVAVMLVFNGELTAVYGVYLATVLIHLVGLLPAYGAMKLKKQHAFRKKGVPLWMYLGGVVGVFTTVFNNAAFGHMSVTAIVALSLLANTLTSLLIDTLGLFGMPKRKLRLSTLGGLAFALGGIVWMLIGAEGDLLLAMLLAFGAGITIVLARMINGRLAEQIGDYAGSFVNLLIGSPAAIVCLLLLGRAELSAFTGLTAAPWWTYIGGLLGVVVVLLNNITVLKISAFQFTLLSFVGQVFASLAVDLLLQKGYSSQTLVGGLLIAAGVCLNLLLEQLQKKQEARKETQQ